MYRYIYKHQIKFFCELILFKEHITSVWNDFIRIFFVGNIIVSPGRSYATRSILT